MNSNNSVDKSLKQINKNWIKDAKDTCQKTKQNKTKQSTVPTKRIHIDNRYLKQISTSQPSGKHKSNYHEVAPHPLEWLLSTVLKADVSKCKEQRLALNTVGRNGS